MTPEEYKYSQEHEWICLEPEGKGRMGITDYAQSHLGDVVFLELPPPGTQLKQFGKIGEVESIKAVSDIFTPVSGEVLEINQTVIDEPQLLNQEPYGNGWLVRLKLSNPAELDALMNSDEYDAYIAKLEEEG